MIVFVEANFVLELALKQPEAAQAEEILRLAEAKKVTLVVPAFSLVEPYHKLFRDRSDRRALRSSLEAQVQQMARSADFAQLRQQSNELLAALANKSDVDALEFERTVERIRKCATIVPLTSEVIRAASSRQLNDLAPQDALVFSSIEMFLKTSPKAKNIFANKDSKGFMVKSVTVDLGALGCTVIPNFSDALAYVKVDADASEIKKGK
jgi:predicted nucleic acid-binding protein